MIESSAEQVGHVTVVGVQVNLLVLTRETQSQQNDLAMRPCAHIGEGSNCWHSPIEKRGGGKNIERVSPGDRLKLFAHCFFDKATAG